MDSTGVIGLIEMSLIVIGLLFGLSVSGQNQEFAWGLKKLDSNEGLAVA